ncbi:MAG: sugar kinase [Anaerolineae bacterium]|nr:sugar kinase [Anaerolineae bacterium]
MSSNATQYDLITLGETMWRLSPPSHIRLDIAQTLDIQVGGSESNTAIALARLGKRVAWWSRLPKNPLGQHIAQVLRTYGVDVSGIYWQENARLGTYFIEFGSSPRPTQVIYDRANSAASQMEPSDFDWSALKHTRRLHLTGITPALSQSCLETTRRAIAEAKANGVALSFDINYRAKLWSWDQCRPYMDELATQADLAFIALRDARNLLQKPDATACAAASKLYERWSGTSVIVTQGEKGAVTFEGSEHHEVPAYKVQIVDRVGAGDAFSAGVLCGLLDNKPLPEAVQFGTAAAALKMTVPGDIALIAHHEVEALLASDSTEIQR